MRDKLTQNQRKLVEAVVDLFIMLPNPQCKDIRPKVMSTAFKVLEKELEKDKEKCNKKHFLDDNISENEIFIREVYYKALFEE